MDARVEEVLRAAEEQPAQSVEHRGDSRALAVAESSVGEVTRAHRAMVDHARRGAGAGVRRRRAATSRAVRAESRPRAPRPRPRSPPSTDFALFGWVSPPLAFHQRRTRSPSSPAPGLNLVLPAYDGTGRIEARRDDILARLDARRGRSACAASSGRPLRRAGALGHRVDARGAGALDSIVADYRDHPGLPRLLPRRRAAPGRGDALPRVFAASCARAIPAHPAWNNLLGPRRRSRTRDEWLDYHARLPRQRAAGGAVQRPLRLPAPTATAASSSRTPPASRALAREYGLPFWSIVQLMPHGAYRALDRGRAALAGRACCSPTARAGSATSPTGRRAPDPRSELGPGDDRPRRRAHALVRPWSRGFEPRRAPGGRDAGRRCAWLATEHAGSVPAGGTPFVPRRLGRARSRAARRSASSRTPTGAPYLLVANSDSLAAPHDHARRCAARAACARLGGARRVDDAADHRRRRDAAAWRSTLDRPADFALLRLDGTVRPAARRTACARWRGSRRTRRAARCGFALIAPGRGRAARDRRRDRAPDLWSRALPAASADVRLARRARRRRRPRRRGSTSRASRTPRRRVVRRSLAADGGRRRELARAAKPHRRPRARPTSLAARRARA